MKKFLKKLGECLVEVVYDIINISFITLVVWSTIMFLLRHSDIVIIGSSFKLLNMASNLAIFCGYCVIGSLVVFSPWLYHWIWTKFIAPNTTSSKE